MQETGAAARTLVIVRHAKAEATAATDHERVLTERGRSDAAELGSWLADRGVVPDHAIVSDAARTEATWTAIADAAGWDTDCDLSAGLYDASPDAALDLIRACPAEARTVVVVGHNPTMAYLAEVLDDGDGDDDAVNALMMTGFPTAAAVVLELARDWAELSESGATVRGYHVGHG